MISELHGGDGNGQSRDRSSEQDAQHDSSSRGCRNRMWGRFMGDTTSWSGRNPEGHLIKLSRPCQNLPGPGCKTKAWSCTRLIAQQVREEQQRQNAGTRGPGVDAGDLGLPDMVELGSSLLDKADTVPEPGWGSDLET
nr:hypothetical protein CFP56_01154 [Quercus suber]